MTTFAFIELPPPLDGWITARNAMFPVQSHLADDLTRPGAPDPERILFDLELYLAEHPDKQARVAEGGAELAFRTAVEVFAHGLKEQSLQFYELSLRLRPDDLLTHYNYAVALHVLCYRDAALAEYEWVMRHTTPQEHLRAWILAAQIHAARGNHSAVIQLLEPLAGTVFPSDDDFWDLLGNARDALGVRPTSQQAAVAAQPSLPPKAQAAPQATAQPTSAAAGKTCAKCGTALKATTKFCPGCGTRVEALVAPSTPSAPSTGTCVHCGKPRRAGAKFCGVCGKA